MDRNVSCYALGFPSRLLHIQECLSTMLRKPMLNQGDEILSDIEALFKPLYFAGRLAVPLSDEYVHEGEACTQRLFGGENRAWAAARRCD